MCTNKVKKKEEKRYYNDRAEGKKANKKSK